MKRHLLAAELGLELAEPVAELLHMAVEEHGQLQHVPPAFHTPGEGGDVRLQLPGNTGGGDCGDDDEYGDGDDDAIGIKMVFAMATMIKMVIVKTVHL